jgi:hypothetical protein
MEKLSRYRPHTDMGSTIRFFYNSLEISLWKNIIPLLSDTHPVGILVQRLYEIYAEKTWIKALEMILTWIILGFGFGFILGLVWNLFQ